MVTVDPNFDAKGNQNVNNKKTEAPTAEANSKDAQKLQDGLNGSKAAADTGKGTTLERQIPENCTANYIGNGTTHIKDANGKLVRIEVDCKSPDFNGNMDMVTGGDVPVLYLNVPKSQRKNLVNQFIDTGTKVISGKGQEKFAKYLPGRAPLTGFAVLSLPVLGSMAGAADLISFNGGTLEEVVVQGGKSLKNFFKNGLNWVKNGLNCVKGLFTKGGAEKAVKLSTTITTGGTMAACSDSDDLSSTSAEAKAETGITKGQIANYVCNKLNNQADENKTTDGITYSFWSTADNKDNVTAGIKVGENLQLTFGKDITNKNTVDYINQIKPNLKTDDGYGYSYTVDASDNAQVTFTKDDGGDAVTYTHQVGNDLTLGGVAKSLNDMLNTIGLGAGDGELPLGLNSSKDSYDQSKDGLQLKLLSTNLDDIASGNVNVQLSIGTQQVTGKLSTQGGNIKIGDGAAVSRIEKYKTADGDEVSGLMVNIGDDKFIITTDYGHKVDIITNFDDEDRISTRNYETSSSTFNTSNATDADKYFNDKKGNLTTAEGKAKERYDDLCAIESTASTKVDIYSSVK